MNLTAMQFLVAVPLVALAVYLVVRIGSAAFFKSKQQFDNQQPKGQQHGTPTE